MTSVPLMTWNYPSTPRCGSFQPRHGFVEKNWGAGRKHCERKARTGLCRGPTADEPVEYCNSIRDKCRLFFAACTCFETVRIATGRTRRLLTTRFEHAYALTTSNPMFRQAPLNAYFEALLETGVDEMAWDDVGDDNVSDSRTVGDTGRTSRASVFCVCHRVSYSSISPPSSPNLNLTIDCHAALSTMLVIRLRLTHS